jgi:hypothetical protein
VPSRLLTAHYRVVPFVPCPELGLLESWRDDRLWSRAAGRLGEAGERGQSTGP